MRRLYECCQLPTDCKISSNLIWKEKTYFKYKTRYCNRPLEDFILYYDFKHIPQKVKNYKQIHYSYSKINYAECLTIGH
jgi:hypothetical protein